MPRGEWFTHILTPIGARRSDSKGPTTAVTDWTYGLDTGELDKRPTSGQLMTLTAIPNNNAQQIGLIATASTGQFRRYTDGGVVGSMTLTGVLSFGGVRPPPVTVLPHAASAGRVLALG